MSENRQKYLRNDELRAEIAYTVGVDPTRYAEHDQYNAGFTKAHMQAIAQALQPADSGFEIHGSELVPLYEHVCNWAGGQYNQNAGNAWGLNRENLKLIHAALEARPPTEVPTP